MAENKKLNGRPLLKTGKRTKKIDARFTEDEYQQVIALEQELGVSKTELVRMRVLFNAENIVTNSKEIIKRLDWIGAEMGRIGNNINQLARHANTLKLQGFVPPEVVGRSNALLDTYLILLQSLESVIRKLIRMMGK